MIGHAEAAPETVGAQDRSRSQPFTPLAAFESAVLLSSELLTAAVSIARRRRRDAGRVRAEYDDGYWKNVLAARRWESCRTVEEFLNPSGKGWRTCKIDNRFVRASHADYYRYRSERLASILAASTEAGCEIVEIGCGYGANLLALSSSARWPALMGLDVSPTAIRAAREIASHFGLANRLRFEEANITRLTDTARSLLQNRVVFTYYCLEQLPRDTATAIQNLIDTRPRAVIHIEPIAELLRWYSPKDLLSYAHILRHDYQRSLLRTLRARADEGRVRIHRVERLYYAPGVRHDPALIVWEPA